MAMFKSFTAGFSSFSLTVHLNEKVMIPRFLSQFFIDKPKEINLELDIIFNSKVNKKLAHKNKIIVFKKVIKEEEKISTLLDEMVYLILANQKELKVLLIHGAGIIIDGECYVFIGDSGEGKTTTTAILSKNNNVINDDIIMWHAEGNLISSVPKIKNERFVNNFWAPVYKVFLIKKADKNKIFRISENKIEQELERNVHNFHANSKLFGKFVKKNNIFYLYQNVFMKEEFIKTIKNSKI